VSGADGCVNEGGRQGCASAPCLDGETVLALAANGAHLYTGSTDSLNFESTSPGAVATFARTAGTGALTFVGCVRRTDAVSDVLPVPRLGSVLVATLFGDRGLGVARAGVDLYTAAADGALARRRRLVCAEDPGSRRCPVPFAPESSRLALGRRGDTLYVSFFFGGVAALRVGPGGVARLPGRWGCVVSRDHYMPPRQCTRTGPEIGPDMVASPDGRNLYVGTLGNGPGNGSYYAGGVEAFSIQR
jgi:hypothetical protein